MTLSGPHPAATARTSDEARAGRTAQEWAAVRDPESARRAWAAVIADAFDGRDRLIHRGFASSYEAWSRRDWELNTLLVSPDQYVFRAADLREMLPDVREQYRGVEGYLEAQDLLTDVWSPIRVELMELVLADRERIVALARWSGRGARSGTPFEQNGLLDNVFRDGLAVEQTYWWTAARGAEALGLELPRR